MIQTQNGQSRSSGSEQFTLLKFVTLWRDSSMYIDVINNQNSLLQAEHFLPGERTARKEWLRSLYFSQDLK